MSYLYGSNFISVTRGSSLDITTHTTVEDADGNVENLDLTGVTVYFTVKAFVEDKIPLFHKQGIAGAGFTIASPKSGKISFSLSVSDVQKIPVGVHVYDMWVSYPSGDRKQIVENQQLEVRQGTTFR